MGFYPFCFVSPIFNDSAIATIEGIWLSFHINTIAVDCFLKSLIRCGRLTIFFFSLKKVNFCQSTGSMLKLTHESCNLLSSKENVIHWRMIRRIHRIIGSDSCGRHSEYNVNSASDFYEIRYSTSKQYFVQNWESKGFVRIVRIFFINRFIFEKFELRV